MGCVTEATVLTNAEAIKIRYGVKVSPIGRQSCGPILRKAPSGRVPPLAAVDVCSGAGESIRGLSLCALHRAAHQRYDQPLLGWAGATWGVNSSWTLTGVAYYQDFRDTGADPWMFIMSADYAFSKRTDVFLNVAYTRNKDGSNLKASGFGSVNPGENQTAAVLGIRHKF